jgi:hypothetical protein
MAVERWAEVRDNQIMNTMLVDPETEDGQEYLEAMRTAGATMMLEADAVAVPYPYWTPPEI